MHRKNHKQNIYRLLLLVSFCCLLGCSDNSASATVVVPPVTPELTTSNSGEPATSAIESVGLSALENTRYDIWFRKSTRLYMMGVDWRLLKAQCYAESRFDARAVSPVGAKGACQFMPGTWADVENQLRLFGDPFDAQLNINFAAYYMSKLRAQWSSPRPEKDLHSLAMASYNAGFGNILNAQRKCNDKVLYDEIIACLPQVTGRHSNETITYVERIWRFYFVLIVL